MIHQGNHNETGRIEWRYCDVERVSHTHREEENGEKESLWRCVSCGYAEGEDLQRAWIRN